MVLDSSLQCCSLGRTEAELILLGKWKYNAVEITLWKARPLKANSPQYTGKIIWRTIDEAGCDIGERADNVRGKSEENLLLYPRPYTLPADEAGCVSPVKEPLMQEENQRTSSYTPAHTPCQLMRRVMGGGATSPAAYVEV